MTETPATEAADDKRKPIWHWVIVATFIAVAIAGGYALFSGDEITTPQQYQAHGKDWAFAVEAGYAFAIPLLTTLVVWLVFAIFVFRPRARFWKALLAFVIMLLVTTIVATPVRLVSFAMAISADDAAVQEVREASRARVRALRQGVAAADGHLVVTVAYDDPHSVADMEAEAADLRAAYARFRAYRAAVTAEMQATRDRIAALDAYEGSKQPMLAFYDDNLSPSGITQRHLAATDHMIAAQLAVMEYLLANRSMWTFRDGRFGFFVGSDLATLERLEAERGAAETAAGQVEDEAAARRRHKGGALD